MMKSNVLFTKPNLAVLLILSPCPLERARGLQIARKSQKEAPLIPPITPTATEVRWSRRIG